MPQSYSSFLIYILICLYISLFVQAHHSIDWQEHWRLLNEIFYRPDGLLNFQPLASKCPSCCQVNSVKAWKGTAWKDGKVSYTGAEPDEISMQKHSEMKSAVCAGVKQDIVWTECFLQLELPLWPRARSNSQIASVITATIYTVSKKCQYFVSKQVSK